MASGPTLWESLRFQAERDPDKECVVDIDTDGSFRSLSYGELQQRAERLAAGLRRAGIGAGDRVALRLRNSAEFLLALYATARAGAIVVPTIRQYSAEELRFSLEDCGASCLIFEAEDAELVGAAAPRGLLAVLARGERAAGPTLGELESEDAVELPPVGDGADALIFYTSGSTSRPKGVVLTHRAILHSCLIDADGWRIRPADRTYVVLPMFHCNALFIQAMPALLSGATVILADRFSASGFLAEARRFGATLANLTAGAARSLLVQPERDDDREHAIRLLTFALPLRRVEIEALERRFGAPLRMCYGLTESAAGGIRTPSHLEPRSGWQSLGRPQPGWEVALAEPEEALEAAPGEAAGEILLRGPGLMDRYWEQPELTAATLRDGWLRTGDLGRLTEDGYIYFHSREKDMLKPKGENVAASEIEQVLEQHPAVVEAAVIGLFDPHEEERVVAVLAGDEGQGADLREHCSDRLAAFKVPAEFVWVAELPKTSIGKVNKGELRGMLG